MAVRRGRVARAAGRAAAAPRPRAALVGCLIGVVLALAGCASTPAGAPVAGSSAERTVTELAAPPGAEATTAEPGPSGPRPETGAVVLTRGASGRGELAIDNGTGKDALVTLARQGSAVRSVYVRAGDDTDLRGIADGTYEIFVAQGSGWNGELRRFTDGPEYSKFADPAPFSTSQEPAGTRYTRLSITLTPVGSGNGATSPIDPGAFPA